MKLLLLITLLALTSCATRPKTYLAPDATKVTASAHRLTTAVTKARATATTAQGKVEEAHASAERVVVISGTIKQKLIELFRNAPPELREAIASLQSDVEQQQAEEGVLTQRLTDAQATHLQLAGELTEAETAKIQFQKDAIDYLSQADKLADEASKERAARIKAEKSLSWYRWHWFLGIIISVGGILLCGLLAFLKFTGRLALRAAPLAALLSILLFAGCAEPQYPDAEHDPHAAEHSVP